MSCQMVRMESAPAERRVDSSDECASAQICMIKKGGRLVDGYVTERVKEKPTLSSWLSNVLIHSSSLIFQSFTNPSDADVTSC